MLDEDFGEPVGLMYLSDLLRFNESETFAHAFSIEVGNPNETSVPLYCRKEAK